MIRSEIGHTTPTDITLRDMDLSREIIGQMSFVETLFLCALARRPTPQEKALADAILVIALDHGLTPVSIAARLIHTSAPENIPGAVAAGLLGAGSRYLGTSTLAANQFREWTADISAGDSDAVYERKANEIVASHKSTGKRFAGYGHPIHKKGDPRVAALRKVVQANGFYGKGWRLADALSTHLSSESPSVPMNASGAVGATIFDMDVDPIFAIGLTLVGRCGGLLAHIMEEMKNPIGQEIWELVATQDPRVDFGRVR